MLCNAQMPRYLLIYYIISFVKHIDRLITQQVNVNRMCYRGVHSLGSMGKLERWHLLVSISTGICPLYNKYTHSINIIVLKRGRRI